MIVDMLFDYYSMKFSREFLIEETERFVYKVAHPDNAFSGGDGPVAEVVRKLTLDGITNNRCTVEEWKELVSRLLEHFDVVGFKPVVSRVREALALVVALKRNIERIHLNFQGVLDELVELSDRFEGSEELVYVVGFEEMEKLVRELFGKVG